MFAKLFMMSLKSTVLAISLSMLNIARSVSFYGPRTFYPPTPLSTPLLVATYVEFSRGINVDESLKYNAQGYIELIGQTFLFSRAFVATEESIEGRPLIQQLGKQNNFSD